MNVTNMTRALLYSAAIATIIINLIVIGLMNDLSKSDWASWVQAFGAIAAILASGAIATLQARRQYTDAARLQREAQHQADIRISEAVESLSDWSVQHVLYTIRELKRDYSVFKLIATGKRHFDRTRVTHIQEDLEAIPLPGLPTSAMVASIIRMRANTRQIESSIEMALTHHQNVSAASFVHFCDALESSHMGMCRALITIEREAQIVKDRKVH